MPPAGTSLHPNNTSKTSATNSLKMRLVSRESREGRTGIGWKSLPLYCGKRVEKELTSSMPPSFHEGSNFSTFQRSMLGSSSHGLGLSCFPFFRHFFPSCAPSDAEADAIPKVRRRRPRGGAAWPRGRREAAAGWTTGEAAAYPGSDGGRRLREREDGGGREKATARR
jgi:hypothetical protein